MAGEPEPTIESRRVYQGRVVSLRVDTVRLRHGGTAPREVVEHAPCVCIVPVEHGRVLLVRQYRKAVGETLLEVPAGGIDPEEKVQPAAARELLEETGHTATHFERLTSFWTSPGFCTELMHAFLATGLTAGQQQQEEDEDITVEWVPLGDVSRLISEGVVRDAKSIVALLLALQRLERRDSPVGPG